MLLVLVSGCGLLLLLCLIAPWMSAQWAWPIALWTIAFPWLYLASLVLVLMALPLRRWRWIVPAMLGLIGGLAHAPAYLSWHSQKPGKIRILSMNCRYFDALSVPSSVVKANIDACKPLLTSIRPDVLCAQDFSTHAMEDNERIEAYVRNGLAMPYFVYEMPSLATYSRHFIGAYTCMRFPDTYNSFCAVDVRLDGRMLRVYNLHLESYGLEREPGENLVVASFKRLRSGIRKRSLQADLVAASVAQSPYPVIVCGDCNDVPTSYVYRRLVESLQDGFRQAGRGLGFSYVGKIPGLRIDYMFCSKELRFTGCNYISGPAFLDHRWIVGDLVWR